MSPYLTPLSFPLAMPLPLPPLPTAPPKPPLPPLIGASSPPRSLSLELGRAAGAGVANLVGAREDGGFSTKDVSVVMNVSSPRSGRDTWGTASSSCLARLNDSGIGAYD